MSLQVAHQRRMGGQQLGAEGGWILPLGAAVVGQIKCRDKINCAVYFSLS